MTTLTHIMNIMTTQNGYITSAADLYAISAASFGLSAICFIAAAILFSKLQYKKKHFI